MPRSTKSQASKGTQRVFTPRRTSQKLAARVSPLVFEQVKCILINPQHAYSTNALRVDAAILCGPCSQTPAPAHAACGVIVYSSVLVRPRAAKHQPQHMLRVDAAFLCGPVQPNTSPSTCCVWSDCVQQRSCATPCSQTPASAHAACGVVTDKMICLDPKTPRVDPAGQTNR